MYLYHGRANAIHPYERDITMYKHLDILKILIQYYFQEIFPNKDPPPQSPMEITRAAAIGFESGFSGFKGLIVTSPV
jgi:hypothetical protein